MKAILPPFARWMGYLLLTFTIFVPAILFISGVITNENIALLKEVIRLFVVAGLVMIILAQKKEENEQTIRLRVKAMRSAFYLTIFYLFMGMFYRLYQGDAELMFSSSFLVYLVMHTICLEFFFHKAKVDLAFKNKTR